MKRILALLSVLLFIVLAIPYKVCAQTTRDGVEMSKTIRQDPTNPNRYTLSLETYVTGDETHSIGAIDVALILDMSFSMNEISSGKYELYGTGAYNISSITGLSDWDAVKKLPSPSGEVSLSGSSEKAYFTNYAILKDGAYYSIALARDGSYNVHILAVKKNSDGSAYDIVQDYGKVGSSKFNTLTFNTSVTLYSTSEVGRKIDLLKTASNRFIDILANGSSSVADHYMSILGFNNSKYINGENNITESSAGDGATVIKQFKQLINSTNVSALHSAINNNLTYTGQTYPQYAVKLTKALYDKQKWSSSTLFKDNGHQKVVVLMTDGEPGSGSFKADAANATVDALHILKSTYGAKVYAVGVFDESISVSDTYQYMNAASSNYPTATSYNVGDATAHDYFRVVGEKSLEEIFSDIAEEVISGGAAVEMTSTNSDVRDYLTNGFKLPDGANSSIVSVNAYHCIGYDNSTHKYLFDSTPIDPKTLKNSSNLSVTVNTSDKSVIITGYDYKANYVRKIVKTGQADTYDGYKLVFSFPIEVDFANNPGGANLSTNTSQSGAYFDEGSGRTIISEYITPTVKVPNIIVKKSGLKAGESAVFTVCKLSAGGGKGDPTYLVATATEDNQEVKAVLKIQQPGRYVVEEITSWSWAYTSSTTSSYAPDDTNKTNDEFNAIGFGPQSEGYAYEIPFVKGTSTTGNSVTRNVNDFTCDGNLNGTVFEFINTAKGETPEHSEKYKDNNFVN